MTEQVIVRQVKVQARARVRTHIVVLDFTNNDLYNIDGVLHNYNFIDGDCPKSQAEYAVWLKHVPKEDEVLLVTVEVNRVDDKLERALGHRPPKVEG